MALVTVTGKLSDLGRQVIPSELVPVLEFHPSGPAVGKGYLFSEKPRRATLNASTGAFSVELEVTDGLVPKTWYIAVIRYFAPGGQMQAEERLGIQLFVPPGGGEISSFPGIPISPDSVWVSLTPPPANWRGFYLHAAPGDPDKGTPTGSGRFYKVF